MQLLNNIKIFYQRYIVKGACNMINQKQLALELNEIYVEYYNDFLTVERFATYKGWSLWFTKQVLNSGRKINHNQTLLNELYSK